MRTRVVGWLGVLVAVVCVAAAVVAVADGEVELTPVMVVWAYIALAMRAAHLTAVHNRETQKTPPMP